MGRLMEKEGSACDGSFKFECRCCGTCCGSGLEIFLNPRDVWNLRVHLKKPTGLLIEKYLTLECRSEYGSYPLCLIKNHSGYCPFLEDRLCSVHPARPAGCRLFPLVYYYDGSRNPTFELARERDFCSGDRDGHRYTIESWLAVNGFGDYEKVIEIQQRLAGLTVARLDDARTAALFGILYDFDSMPYFPFRGKYPLEKSAADRVMDWICRQTDRFLESL